MRWHVTSYDATGVEANVMPYSYNLPAAFPKSLLPLIPNRYYSQEGGRPSKVKGERSSELEDCTPSLIGRQSSIEMLSFLHDAE